MQTVADLETFKRLYTDVSHVQSLTEQKFVALAGENVDWNTLTPAIFIPESELVGVSACQIAIGTVVFDAVCLAVGGYGLRASANPNVFAAMGQAIAPVASKLEAVIATMSAAGATKADLAWGVFKILKTIYSGGSLGAVFSAFKNSLTWWNALLFGITGIATIIAFIATDGLAFAAEVVIVLASFGFLVSDIAKAVSTCGITPQPAPPEPVPQPGPCLAAPAVALRTGNATNYVTVVDGGGLGAPSSGISVIQTNRREVGPWEKFTIVPIDPTLQSFALKTNNGHYITAVNGGGLGGPNDATSPIHTDAVHALSWESLILEQQTDGTYAIRTPSGYYITAINGGGIGGPNNSSCIIHTDATQQGGWEVFYFDSLWPMNGIMAFHQGYANNGQLWLASAPDGVRFAADKQIANVGMSSGPSAVLFNSAIYVFHQGYGDNGQLWYSVLQNNQWLADTQVPNTGVSSGPGAVVFNGKLYVFHQGYGDNGQLWYNVFDGSNWAGDVQVNNVGMSENPSAVVYDGKIFVFHQGGNQDGSLWYSTFDGTKWASDVHVANTGMSSGPSAVAFNSKLYVFHQGYGDNGQLWYNIFDGSNWAGDQQTPNTGMSSGPAAVVANGMLTVYHQGYGDNGQLWFNQLDGTNWLGDQQVSNVGMSSTPGVIYLPS
jgi:hypothetical protein